MLDSNSLEVISRLKSALLSRTQRPDDAQLARSNRGKKLPGLQTTQNTLTPKVVEYQGGNHLVLTNDVIERCNYRNKRRWSDFYSAEQKTAPADSESSSSDAWSSDDDDDGTDGNPLKRMRLSEILAPLSHPAEIASHPAISKTYKSTCFATLAAEIIEVIEVEQKTLNRFNKLLQVLDGEDWFYQLEENMELPVYDHGLDDSVSAPAPKTESPEAEDDGEFENKRITRRTMPEGQIQITDPFFALPKSLALYESQQQKQRDEAEGDDELSVIQQELVNYLQVSIQRQHEYIKNLSVIRGGLVKADRYKKDLYRWSKEMSEKK